VGMQNRCTAQQMLVELLFLLLCMVWRKEYYQAEEQNWFIVNEVFIVFVAPINDHFLVSWDIVNSH